MKSMDPVERVITCFTMMLFAGGMALHAATETAKHLPLGGWWTFGGCLDALWVFFCSWWAWLSAKEIFRPSDLTAEPNGNASP